MSEENVELVWRIHRAYKSGELEQAIDTYMHPELQWETRWPGLDHSFHGRDGFREWLAKVMEPMDLEMDLIEARALDDDRVFASYKLRGAGRSSGIPTEMAIYEVDTFEDSQLLRRQVFYSEGEALEAAGLRE